MNQYRLAVGKEIRAAKSPPKQGTRVVPLGNQGSSPGCTVTFTEPPLNPHSDTNVSARFEEKPRDDDFSEAWDDEAPQFPDRGMVAAAVASGFDPDRLSDIIADYRGDLLEELEAGNKAAQKHPNGTRDDEANLVNSHRAPAIVYCASDRSLLCVATSIEPPTLRSPSSCRASVSRRSTDAC